MLKAAADIFCVSQHKMKFRDNNELMWRSLAVNRRPEAIPTSQRLNRGYRSAVVRYVTTEAVLQEQR